MAIAEQAADLDVSCMFFASIAFWMVLVHLVRHSHQKLQKVAWKIISSTTCILIGIFVSNTWSNLVVWLLHAETERAILIVHLVGYVIWYAGLQIAYTWLLIRSFGMETDAFIMEMEFWAPMLSIVGSWSSMIWWASLQREAVARYTGTEEAVIVAFAMVLVCSLLKGVVMSFTGNLRQKFEQYDGKVDKHEDVWNTCTEQCENTVFCLTVSHLTAQAARFAIMGTMPLPNGAVAPGSSASFTDAAYLVGASFLFIALLMLSLKIPTEFEGISLWRTRADIKGILQVCVTWCWLYSGDWLVGRACGPGAIGAILQAVLVTVVCLCLILVLNYLERIFNTDAVVQELEAMVLPVSLWIAFAWKWAFITSLVEISDGIDVAAKPLQVAFLSAVMAAFLIPSWHARMLPMVHGEHAQNLLLQESLLSPRSDTPESATDALQQCDDVEASAPPSAPMSPPRKVVAGAAAVAPLSSSPSVADRLRPDLSSPTRYSAPYSPARGAGSPVGSVGFGSPNKTLEQCFQVQQRYLEVSKAVLGFDDPLTQKLTNDVANTRSVMERSP